MSDEDSTDQDKTALRQEPNDEKTTIKGSPIEPDDEKTTIKGSKIAPDEDEAPEGNDEATVLRKKPVADESANATILREPAGDNATILRSAESGEATILRSPGEGMDDGATILRRQGDGGDLEEDDRTIMRDDAFQDDDDDRTVMNTNIDDDATIIGNESDTTYVARLNKQQESKGNTEAGRLLKNRFVLEEKVGSGGMGDVYKALDLRQQEAQERDPYIAIKLLNESFSRHKDAFLSLQRETSRTRAIPHPNIMGVYDFDKEGDTAFMAMELLDGKPLDDYLKEHPEGVSTEDAWNILDGICKGLMRAHDAGIVHSDFKPGNIFYTKDKVAKVFDFGIARAVSNPNELEADGEKTVFDAGSLGALTPTYASYEMLKGLEPSKSDDVYAVALVAYELFMGKHPYDRVPADKALDRGITPKPVADIKRRQWRALKKALALKGEDRTQTIDEFYEAMFAEDPPYLIYSGVAAAFVGLVGFGVYQSMQETVKPEELAALEAVVLSNRGQVDNRLRNPDWTSDDWHEQLNTALNRWRGANLQIQENPEWTWDADNNGEADGRTWETFDELLVDTEDANDEIPDAEEKILAAYISEITKLRDNARGIGRRDRPDVEMAIELLTTADSYMGRVLENYRHIDESQVVSMAGSIDGDLQYRTDVLADIQAVEDAEAARVAKEEEERLAREAEDRAIADRNKAYIEERDELENILRCKGDIPDNELTDAGQRLSAMRSIFPEQFIVDTPGIVTAFRGCIKQRIGINNPPRAREVKTVVEGYLPGATEISGLIIDDKDPCDAHGLEGFGYRSRSWCADQLAEGGSGPQLVVIPALGIESHKFAISKTEIKVGDYNQFCEKTGCQTLPGSPSIPATNLTVSQAEAYTEWLSNQSGKQYRLPTVDEWSHAASAVDGDLDENVNCTVDSRGVRLGDKLLSALSGRPNSWGLYNHVGNAREWAIQQDGSLRAMGGAHTDPKAECTLKKWVAHQGSPDPVTGFRVLRIITPKSSLIGSRS